MVTDDVGLLTPRDTAQSGSRVVRSLGLLILVMLAAWGAQDLWETLLNSRGGLQGEYFSDLDFQGDRFERHDRSLDFLWEARGPLEGVPAENFSARWRGEIYFPADGVYQIILRTDDGARLTIGDEVLIDEWWPQPATEYARSMEFTKGWKHLEVDFFQKSGNAECRLMWIPPDDVRQAVPPRNLRPPKS